MLHAQLRRCRFDLVLLSFHLSRTGLVDRPVSPSKCIFYSSNGSMVFYKMRGGVPLQKITLISNMILQKTAIFTLELYFLSGFLQRTILSQSSACCYCPSCCFFVLLALVCCSPPPRSGNCPPMLRGNAGVPDIWFSKVPHAVHSWVYTPKN